jgi:group I intron endonuclease
MKIYKILNGELRDGYSDIYKITNKINNNLYIGKAKHFLGKRLEINGAFNRFKEHIRKCNEFKIAKENCNKYFACSKLYNAILKYGIDNFEIQVLCICKTELENEMEIFFIKEYKTYWSDNCGGYNLTKGGDGISGYKHTEEAIEK